MRIELPSGTPAELAVPAGDAVRGVVVAPDIGGLRPLFDELAARLAADHGWAVCAPEPFPGRQQMKLEERFAAMPGLADADQVGDLLAAGDHLAGLGAGPVAAVGFCMGGMYAMKAAAAGRFDRVVSFYGMIRIPEAWRGAGQAEPLDAVGGPGAAAVLAHCGTRDPWLPETDIDDLEAAGAEVVRYEGADHGFAHDPARPAHRPDDAAAAWRRTVAFLAR